MRERENNYEFEWIKKTMGKESRKVLKLANFIVDNTDNCWKLIKNLNN